VDGLDGIYIATQLGSVASSMAAFQSQKTLISFNKGGMWRHLTAPERDIYGNMTCNPDFRSWLLGQTCSLHVAQRFHAVLPLMGARPLPILSRRSAIGLIVATGNLGSYIDTTDQYNVYRSNDGGLVWREILRGTHLYTTGDYGGLLVAVIAAQLTSELL